MKKLGQISQGKMSPGKKLSGYMLPGQISINLESSCFCEFILHPKFQLPRLRRRSKKYGLWVAGWFHG